MKIWFPSRESDWGNRLLLRADRMPSTRWPTGNELKGICRDPCLTVSGISLLRKFLKFHFIVFLFWFYLYIFPPLFALLRSFLYTMTSSSAFLWTSWVCERVGPCSLSSLELLSSCLFVLSNSGVWSYYIIFIIPQKPVFWWETERMGLGRRCKGRRNWEE